MSRTLELGVLQVLAGEDDVNAVALAVGLALEVHVEIDGAHDAVPEFLVDQRLEGGPVHVDELVQAVDEGVGGDRAVGLCAHPGVSLVT
jgi:hypothetical protein